MRAYDEYRDILSYGYFHKVDFEEAVRNAGIDLNEDQVNKILDGLYSDWDDDADGPDSYWLEGKVTA